LLFSLLVVDVAVDIAAATMMAACRKGAPSKKLDLSGVNANTSPTAANTAGHRPPNRDPRWVR